MSFTKPLLTTARDLFSNLNAVAQFVRAFTTTKKLIKDINGKKELKEEFDWDFYIAQLDRDNCSCLSSCAIE